MANTFKKVATSDIGTTASTIYTAPASTTTIIIGFILANTTSSLITVDVSAASTSLGVGLPIPAGGSLSVLDGKIVLEAADTVVVQSSDAISVDSYLSIMEIA